MPSSRKCSRVGTGDWFSAATTGGGYYKCDHNCRDGINYFCPIQVFISALSHHFGNSNATCRWPTTNLGIILSSNPGLLNLVSACMLALPPQWDVWWCITKIGLPGGRQSLSVTKAALSNHLRSSGRDGWLDTERLHMM